MKNRLIVVIVFVVVVAVVDVRGLGTQKSEFMEGRDRGEGEKKSTEISTFHWAKNYYYVSEHRRSIHHAKTTKEVMRF